MEVSAVIPVRRMEGEPVRDPAVEPHAGGAEMQLIDPSANRPRFFERRAG